MIVSQVSSLPGVADGQAGRCRSPGKRGQSPLVQSLSSGPLPGRLLQPPVSHF